MKPQFSIFALLLMTTYAGVNVAAWAQPLGFWPYVAFSLAAAWLLYLVAIAAVSAGAPSAFARGMLLVIVLFGPAREFVPTHDMPYVLYGSGAGVDLNNPVQVRKDYNRESLVNQNLHLGFGLAGGCLALWRYRWLQGTMIVDGPRIAS